MELRVLGGALWRQRLLVLLILVVTALAVAIGLRVAPKTYTSSATLSVAAATVGDQPPTDLELGTMAELARSRDVVAGVRDLLLREYGVDRSADDLRRAITGEWVAGTLLVRVSVTDSDALTAARIANAVVDRALPQEVSDVATSTEDSALPPTTYSSPDLLLSGAVGAVLACILATCGALVRDHRTRTVDDASAVEEAATAPLLAHVPSPRDPTTLPALYPGTAAAEVFRHLRVALEAESSRGTERRVVVAGVTAGDVNVWLGANLAISLAKVGRRVLLVDGRLAGLSGPTRVEEAEPDTPGLYDVLMGVDLDDALSPGPVDLLSVLPAGTSAGENPRSLLESHFSEVVDAARDRFDVVVVLAPPLDRSDDARVMAAGGLMLLAVPEGGVSAAALRAHADRVRAVGARLLGTVLVGRRAQRAAAA